MATCGGFAPLPIAVNIAGVKLPNVSTDLVNRLARHPRFRVVNGSVAYQPAHYAKPLSCAAFIPQWWQLGLKDSYH